ncbi:MAG TPA: hypothetical protein VHA56_12560 [Mucilaginibacter sp.]|nr:hypothetical protein [Mucilaginibacter sp.]
MNRIKLFVTALIAVFTLTASGLKAQTIADALQQLALDYQKLAGMKSMLQQMYKGYEVVSKGYNSVKNISKGNFDLHDAYLNGLLLVSPAVRKYPRVADIINDQAAIVKEYKTAANAFKQDKHITPNEIGYIMDVYNNIVSRSLENLNELSMVMADNQLRMSDDERLQLIDHMYAGGHDQLTFLRQFDQHINQVAAARAAQDTDRQNIKKLYGIR